MRPATDAASAPGGAAAAQVRVDHEVGGVGLDDRPGAEVADHVGLFFAWASEGGVCGWSAGTVTISQPSLADAMAEK